MLLLVFPIFEADEESGQVNFLTRCFIVQDNLTIRFDLFIKMVERNLPFRLSAVAVVNAIGHIGVGAGRSLQPVKNVDTSTWAISATHSKN